MFKTIVVPLDGSAAAERVLTRIAPLRESASTLLLVRVVPGSGGGLPAASETLRLIEAESYLSFLAAELGHGVRAEVRRGAVVEEILAAAGAAGADLIGLSSWGESGPGRATVGATAGQLVLGAACPVLVLGPAQETHEPFASRPSRVIVALDGSAASESCLVPALRVARGSGATLILLHVIEPLWAAGDSAVAAQQAADTGKTAARLDGIVAQYRKDGVTARSLIVRGDPASEILSQVIRRQADLLCLSTASRGPLGRLFFGTVAQKLIGVAPVPVIAVRRGPAS